MAKVINFSQCQFEDGTTSDTWEAYWTGDAQNFVPPSGWIWRSIKGIAGQRNGCYDRSIEVVGYESQLVFLDAPPARYAMFSQHHAKHPRNMEIHDTIAEMQSGDYGDFRDIVYGFKEDTLPASDNHILSLHDIDLLDGITPHQFERFWTSEHTSFDVPDGWTWYALRGCRNRRQGQYCLYVEVDRDMYSPTAHEAFLNQPFIETLATFVSGFYDSYTDYEVVGQSIVNR